MIYSFLRGDSFLKFDWDRLLRATFLRVVRFPAGGLPYFGTSVRQIVNGDGGLRSRKHSSNNRITLLIYIYIFGSSEASPTIWSCYANISVFIDRIRNHFLKK